MRLNIILGQTSLVGSIIFLCLIILGILGIPINIILGDYSMLFEIPLYLLIIVSFVYTLSVWINYKTKENLRYFVYSVISGSITSGTLLYLLFKMSKALESF